MGVFRQVTAEPAPARAALEQPQQMPRNVIQLGALIQALLDIGAKGRGRFQTRASRAGLTKQLLIDTGQ